MSVATVIHNLVNEARAIVTSELATNPNLSKAEAVKAVESSVDALLSHAGILGTLAEPVVNLFIEQDVPAIYDKLVEDILGSKPGAVVITAQS